MNIVTIARLTIRETQRRRILWIGALMGMVFLVIFGLGFHFIYIDVRSHLSGAELEFPILFLTLAGI